MDDINLKFNIDVEKIASEFKDLAKVVEQDLQQAAGQLAAIAHAKIKTLAEEELKSTVNIFMDNFCEKAEEITPGVWILWLNEEALWIEEGRKSGDMKPDLLRNNAKTSAKGYKYKVIPFDYGKPPSQMTPYTKTILEEIKKNLKKEKVSMRNIERNPDKSPRLGKLHEFDFGNPGGRMGGPGKGNTPVMKGLSIYQSLTKTGNVRRDIMTFRTVSSGPGSEGKWIHPGLEAKKIMDKALEWSIKEWEEKILPDVLSKWKD